jgi:nitroreductase
MDVSEAVARRMSVRAFKPDPVPAALVREILTAAGQAPSGGNLQPWRVYALTGAPLAALKAKVAVTPMTEESPEFHSYPPNLWEPMRTRRYECGEDLYASIGVTREDRAGRLAQFANNGQLFGAPVGIFIAVDRRIGVPQWADAGIYLSTLMLLATGKGLDTCPQGFWSRYPRTLAEALDLPEHHIVYAGLALGYRDPDHPINGWRTRRDPFETWGELRGFEA